MKSTTKSMSKSKHSDTTPLMAQYLEIKAKYKDMILLYRMGDFYETFYEDAKIIAKVLGIALTKRAHGKSADVPLAGFPYHALDNYLPKLIKAGHRVAICEQVEDPKKSQNRGKAGSCGSGYARHGVIREIIGQQKQQLHCLGPSERAGGGRWLRRFIHRRTLHRRNSA